MFFVLANIFLNNDCTKKVDGNKYPERIKNLHTLTVDVVNDRKMNCLTLYVPSASTVIKTCSSFRMKVYITQLVAS